MCLCVATHPKLFLEVYLLVFNEKQLTRHTGFFEEEEIPSNHLKLTFHRESLGIQRYRYIATTIITAALRSWGCLFSESQMVCSSS